MIRKILMVISVQIAVGLLLVAAAITFVSDGSAEAVTASDEGCIVGDFVATYEEKGVAFEVQNVFLCGENLMYSSINADGLRVYNRPEEFD